MAAFTALGNSHHITALLGGVSLLALAACSDKSTLPGTIYEPATKTPPSATAKGDISQKYKLIDNNSITTKAIGEEDNSGPIPVEPDGGIGDGAGPPPIATTLAVGEEDGSGPIPVEPDGGIGDGAGPPPFATTFAVGEEDGQYETLTDPGTVTTLALGEEDGGYTVPSDSGTVTTLAIGEEDGGYTASPDPGSVTTLAIGEEDGGASSYEVPTPDITTLAIREEG